VVTQTVAATIVYPVGISIGFTSLNPGSGGVAGGTNVTISGSGFVTTGNGTATILFDTTPATNVVVVNNGSITCTSPAHAAGAVDVWIITSGAMFRIPGAFTYA